MKVLIDDEKLFPLLLEMRDNCRKGDAYDDPKRKEKEAALDAALFALKYFDQVVWERDYLQGFVDEQRKITEECKEYTDKRNFHCFEDLCDLKEMDICDVCRTQYEHGVSAGVAMSKGYAMAYNADQLRGFTKVVHCKDCQWCYECAVGELRCENSYERNNMDRTVTADWFCADGERKDD